MLQKYNIYIIYWLIQEKWTCYMKAPENEYIFFEIFLKFN